MFRWEEVLKRNGWPASTQWKPGMRDEEKWWRLFSGTAVGALREKYPAWAAVALQPRPVLNLDLGVSVPANGDVGVVIGRRIVDSVQDAGVIGGAAESTPEQAGVSLIGWALADLGKQAVDGRVVVLIDEYDKLVTDALGADGHAEARRRLSVLAGFFSALKSASALRSHFQLMTGVTTLARAGVFSGGNDWVDMTFSHAMANVCGFTWAEIEHVYGDRLAQLAANLGQSPAQVKAEMKKWYNGYLWGLSDVPGDACGGDDGARRLYNPISVNATMRTLSLQSAWANSASNNWLHKVLEHEALELDAKRHMLDRIMRLDVHEGVPLRGPGLLLSAGYATIGEVTASNMQNVAEATLQRANRESDLDLLKGRVGEHSRGDHQE
jgi:hypothetical protein